VQEIPGLPRPLVKICDFGYSKHDNRSAAQSKVVSRSLAARLAGGSKVHAAVAVCARAHVPTHVPRLHVHVHAHAHALCAAAHRAR
jgi:hypothetical protein